MIAKVISENFPPEYLACVEGGIPESKALLDEKFDYIFFTGGTNVGRIVYQAAAKYLTPVTLELGGKSPCIVDRDTNISLTAKRIVWGKFVNAGQTCIAPDYLLVHQNVKEKLIENLELLYRKSKQRQKLPITHNKYTKLANGIKKNIDKLIKVNVDDKLFRMTVNSVLFHPNHFDTLYQLLFH
jgi:acyl-CoA reductase-like NAD-dependent aldehyde dehydrogenase